MGPCNASSKGASQAGVRRRVGGGVDAGPQLSNQIRADAGPRAGTPHCSADSGCAEMLEQKLLLSVINLKHADYFSLSSGEHADTFRNNT